MDAALAEAGIQGHLYFVPILIVLGVVAGYVAGLFGIGGGVVLVPAFVTVFPYLGASHAVLMHSAVGTCLALIVPGAIMSSRKQSQQGNLELAVLRSWLPAVCVGIVLGALLISVFPTLVLKWLFVLFLLCATIHALLNRESERSGYGLPPPGTRKAAGVFIGALSVMLGIGGGTFSVPFYRYFQYPLKRAIALSSATGAFIGAGGAIGAIVTGWGLAGRAPFSLGFVNTAAFLVLTPCMMIFSPLGSRSANALPERMLKRAYIVFLSSMTLYMAYQAIMALEGR